MSKAKYLVIKNRDHHVISCLIMGDRRKWGLDSCFRRKDSRGRDSTGRDACTTNQGRLYNYLSGKRIPENKEAPSQSEGSLHNEYC